METERRVRTGTRGRLLSLLIPALLMFIACRPAAAQDSYDPYQQERAFLGQRVVGGKQIPKGAYDRAKRDWHKILRAGPRAGRQADASIAALGPSVLGTVWIPIGPSPMAQTYEFPDGSGNWFTGLYNGRVSAIAVNPNNPDVIYQGASGGGVWYTNDGGATWTPLYDQQVSLGVGEPSAIAIDPNDTSTIYVGTSGRFVLNQSKGILKSTDGGGSWIVLGSGFPANNTGDADDRFTNQSISVIIVDPSNSNVLYASATNGLFRSTDGGRNWTQGTNGGGDARSLVLDTTSPAGSRILYAGVSGSGVRMSNNGGQSWTQILNTATPAVAARLAGGGGIGHVIVDVAPPMSPPNSAGIQVLYASMEGTGGARDPLGIFQSTDQGGTWTEMPATGLYGSWGVGTQGGYDFTMGVDPASPGDGANDIIYLGLVSQFKSTDSGNTFSGMANFQHVDSHGGWTFVPQPSGPSVVFTGNDGGIYKSTDGGATWSGTGQPGAPSTLNGGGLQTGLFYNLDVKHDATASVTEGCTQDNGIPRTTGSMEWEISAGGDGWDIAFDWVDTSKAYQTGGFYCCPWPCTLAFRSTDSGATWPTVVITGIPNSELGCGLAPVATDPNNNGVVYVSGRQSSLFQSSDSGGNYRNIGNLGSSVGNVDVAKADSNIVAVHAWPNLVFVSTNALAPTVGLPDGVTFTNITRNLPNRAVTRVAIDPNDPTVIYATMSGFDGQTPGQPGHVFRTGINATAWTNISPPLDAPVNAITLDGQTVPTTIYIGTDLGVMRSVNGGASWTVLDDAHFPNVPVTDLVLNSQAGVLRAATYGRGVFELASPSGPVISVNAENGLQFGKVCPPGPASLTLQVFNVGTSDLIVYSVERLFGSTGFTVLANPATPVTISPNSEVDFTIQFTPTTPGTEEAAQIRISSNDPSAPSVDLMATGTGDVPRILTAIADAGNFGDVCLGTFKDLGLTIANSGGCTLSVTGMTSSSAEFELASVMGFPVTIEAGNSIELPIRLKPTSLGAKSANITITSNDPATPNKVVSVTGNTPPGDIRVTGSTDFGDVCPGTLAEKTISVCNVGKCNLTVTSVGFNPACGDFTLINSPFPTVVSPDSCVDVVIRFTPTSVGPKSCTLVITSDDPDTPVVTLIVTGNTPVPSIDVPPDLAFPPTVIQRIGPCASLLPFPISNTGICDLKIVAITIGGPDAAFYSLAGLPSFPIILEPGYVIGEGDLKVAFAPDILDRDLQATITVTYVSDPITGTTANVTRALCGEGVKTGARVLVTAGGVPVAKVERLQIQRINANRNRPQLDTIDVARDLPLVSVVPALPCLPFQYHREYGTVSNPIQLLPGDYQVTATVVVNGKRVRKTVGFNATTCTFNPTIVIDF